MFELENFADIKQIYLFEWVLLIIYGLVLLTYAFFVQTNRISTNPLYRFYTPAVLLKIFSSIVFCCIYIYYYHGGDTVSYFENSRAMVNLGMKDPGSFFTVMRSSASVENYFLFSKDTGYPWPYMYYDPNTFFVTKLMVPFVFVAFRSYLISSVLVSFFSFFGAWQLFLMLNRLYPGMERRLAMGVLFVPSVLFWGSGILKDTITFAAVCWFIYGFYWAFIGKRQRISGAIATLLSMYIMIMVKPYVLIALLPGTLVWFLHARIVRLRSRFIRATIIPFIYVFSVSVGIGILSLFGSKLGKFSIEKMFVTASVTQNDLKQDYYKGSSFDIGSFEPSLSGVVSKVPAAMTVGLFRPFIWEARNVVMLVSGLENLVYLYLATMIILRLFRSPRKFFGLLFEQPILLFLLSYSLIFSVLVGLSTSNFGALVRFKVPFLSSFVVLLLILDFLLDRKNAGYFSATKVPAFDGVAHPENVQKKIHS
jgi:hypothetical protein